MAFQTIIFPSCDADTRCILSPAQWAAYTFPKCPINSLRFISRIAGFVEDDWPLAAAASGTVPVCLTAIDEKRRCISEVEKRVDIQKMNKRKKERKKERKNE